MRKSRRSFVRIACSICLFWICADPFCLPVRSQAQVLFPRFQQDYFAEMPRAFGFITKVDLKERTLTVRLDKDLRTVTIPILDDTELHFRDGWGELEDFFVGQHILCFMYVDDQKKWTYPRSIQDDIHYNARNNSFSKVFKIDRARQTYSVVRQGVTADGQPAPSFFEKEYAYLASTKVWKGASPSGPEALTEGDEVIQQLIERDGSPIAIEILDRAGDEAVRLMQEARYKKDQERLGLTAYVNDLEPLSGSLSVSVPWGGAERATELKPGTTIAITPMDGADTFAASVSSNIRLENRQRIQFVVNPRVTVRLYRGLSLRLFLPNTGPAIPAGRAGIPETTPK